MDISKLHLAIEWVSTLSSMPALMEGELDKTDTKEAVFKSLSDGIDRVDKLFAELQTNKYEYMAREFMVKLDSLRSIRDAQSVDGNWNYDPYMFGMYNGLEAALAIMENREPIYMDAPAEWLCFQDGKGEVLDDPDQLDPSLD